MIKPYNDFNEVEAEIRAATAATPIVYKYRTWEDPNHQRIITYREAWFAHPHQLNDPYDVRPPYNFIVGDIDWSAFRVKLFEAGSAIEKGISDEQLNLEVDKRLEEAKADPVAYFKRTRGEYVNEEKHYDRIGVFSCCTTYSNEPMWAHYGNNHCGFAIGFDVVEMARALNCTVGYVKYNDDPINYYVLGNNERIMDEEIFKKGTRWSVEEEFRFITAGIGFNRERASVFPVETVKEIVFGLNTSKEVIDIVRGEAAKVFPDILFYQVAVKTDAYGFERIRL